MLTLDLVELERRGRLEVDASIPEDDPLWEGAGLRTCAPVGVHLTASTALGDQIFLKGRVSTSLLGECRRCLKELRLPLNIALSLVFVPKDEEWMQGVDAESPDEGLRPYDAGQMVLQLGEVVREELILASPQWPLCSADCRGLCPACGVDLNEETCSCAAEELDPRWSALRALKREE
jgi:uncharacterized protein